MAALTPERKAGMRAAWELNEKLDVIALAFGTSRGRLCNLAKAEDWPRRPKGPRRRWAGEMLAKLEAAWRTDPRNRAEIARSFGTDVSRVYQLARENGWPCDRRRGVSPGTPWSWSRRAAHLEGART